MTPRTRETTRRAALAGLLVLSGFATVGLSGCDPRALAYFLSNEPGVPAPGPSLKGKKVLIVTQATSTGTVGSETIDRELNRELTLILREKVDKIVITPAEKVTAWIEAHPTWTDPGELAKAFEVDMVIVLEIHSFGIEDYKSPGLLEGNAEIHIKVVEYAHPKSTKGKVNHSAPKETNKIYEQDLQSLFPKRGPISIDSGVSKPIFKSKFLKLVATDVSWQFVGHEVGDDIQDTKFN